MKINQFKFFTALCAGVVTLSASTAALAQNQQTGQATFGNLIAALNNISAEVNDLSALNDLSVEDVQVVNIQDTLNGNNVQALNNALNRNNVEILTLQDTLNNNEVIKNTLNNNDVTIDRVVAVDVLSGGNVVVFYR